MKKYNSTDLLNELQADVRALLARVAELRTEDPGILLQQPAPGMERDPGIGASQ